MRLGFPRLLADIWTIFRRDADLIVRIAAPFIFLPIFAAQLLCEPLPLPPASWSDDTAVAAWMQAMAVWGDRGNALGYVAMTLGEWFGLTALAVLLVDRGRGDVRAVLRRTLTLYPRTALASLAAALPIGVGMALLLIPGLYLQGRLAAMLPALAAEQPLGAGASLARSWGMTRAIGWPILAAITVLFLGQYVVVAPLLPIDGWLREPGHENPIVMAVTGAVSSAALAAYQVAVLLLGVALYLRRASSGT